MIERVQFGTVFASLAAIVVWVGFASTLSGQNSNENLPSANEVIERHILAKGGFEVLSSISSLHCVWEKTDADGQWRFERWRVPGKKYANRMLDGSVSRSYGCWVLNPDADVESLKGVSWQVLRGAVRFQHGHHLDESLINTASIDSATRWMERSRTVRCAGIEKIDGKRCYKIEFVNHRDESTIRYFDVETAYLIQQEAVEHQTGGNVVTRKYAKHREFDDIVVPVKQTIISRSRTDVWELKLMERDFEMEEIQFSVPDEVIVAYDRLKSKMELAGGEK